MLQLVKDELRSLVAKHVFLLVFVPLSIMVTPVRGSGQERTQAGRSAADFDISRAWLRDTTMFEPFRVTETRPLRDALADGEIGEDTPLLVVEHDAGKLALLTTQMAYHHVAQGEMAGEPWMVSF